jgi:transketolase
VATRRQGVLKGAYIARKETAPLTHILIGTGSELQLALAAAEELGAGVRVVSMPSMEVFSRQPQSYQEEVLPKSCSKRVSIEAGVTLSWGRYVGLNGKAIGTDTFGLSAPGDIVMRELGITKDAVIAAARAL